MMGLGLIYLFFIAFCFMGCIGLFIYVAIQRLEEKKIENKKHKDYKDY